MSSCHSSTIDACAKCKDVIAIPTLPEHKSNLHHIAVLRPAPLMSVLKLQRINRTTVVVDCIPDCAAYIIDGRQDFTAAVVSCDIMII